MNGSAVSLQWGGGVGGKGHRPRRLSRQARVHEGGQGLVDHAVSVEEDIGYTSCSVSNTPCYTEPRGRLIHSQQVLGLSPTVKANSVTSRGDGSDSIATPTARSASRTPRNLMLQEIIHSGSSTDNWDDLVLGSIGFAPDVMTYDADYVLLLQEIYVLLRIPLRLLGRNKRLRKIEKGSSSAPLLPICQCLFFTEDIERPLGNEFEILLEILNSQCPKILTTSQRH